MKRAGGLIGAALALTFANVAHADDAVRVVIAGPKKDPIAARLEKELVALGFAPVAVGALPDCTGAAVENAVKNAGASAALCSNNGRVAVWTDDGHELKLRDTIVPRDAHGNETMAMQAAEVMRANIAFREPEPVAPPVEAPKPKPATTAAGLDWNDFDSADRLPRKQKDIPNRAPLLTFSAGASYLIGRAASLGGLSVAGSVRLHPYLSLALHVDAPLTGTRATPMTTVLPPDNSHVRMTPGLAGAGIEVPFTSPDSFVIPRVGANVGVAWVHATKTVGTLRDAFGSFVSTTEEVGNTTFAPAGWISAGFSVRIANPVRIVADGLIGTTAGGIIIRNQGFDVARYGTPLASVGLRAELVLP